MKSLEVGKRIRKFIKAKGITQEKLADAINVHKSVLSDALNGKREIDEIVDKVQVLFDLDDDFFTDGINQEGNLRIEQKPHFIAIAHAGLPTAEQGSDYEMQPIVSQLPKYDYTVEVRGDSMYPEYKSGDIVACLNVTNDNFIQWGRVHLLNTSQGVVIKKIYPDGDYIKCVSVNSEEFPPFEIPRESIYSVGLVVGAIRIC